MLPLAERLQNFYDAQYSWWESVSPNEGPLGHPALMYTVNCTVVHSATIWIFHASMYLLYRFGWFSEYKINPQMPREQLVMKVLKEKIAGTLFLDEFAWFAAYYFFLILFKPFIYTGALPSLGTIVWQVVFFFVVNDFLFYWAHRMLHTWPVLYKNIHKQHHEFSSTISLATEYAHPIEAFFANVLPMFMGPGIIEVHFVTFLVWICLRLWESLDGHSGYDFPWSPWKYFRGSTRFHTFHHSHNVGNYGLFPIMDWLMGTDRHYREYLKGVKSKKC